MKIFLFITVFCNTLLISANSNVEQRVSTGFKSLDEFSDKTLLVLEEVKSSPYYIEFLFNESGLNKSKASYNEVIDFEISISDGKDIIVKKINLNLTNGDLGKYLLLFEIPKDYKRKSEITIEVSNIKYNKTLLDYYDRLSITVRKYSKYIR